MSKEGFDIANRVSKKKFSFRSFIKTEKMKTQNTKRNEPIYSSFVVFSAIDLAESEIKKSLSFKTLRNQSVVA